MFAKARPGDRAPAVRPPGARCGVLRHCAAAGAALALMAAACVAAQVTLPPPAFAAASPHATTIAGGTTHSCAIRGGKAYCWGGNASGQLGNGSTISSSTPVAAYTGGVLAGKTLTQISAGNGFTCALDSSGAAYCWGGNANGQLGNNSTINSSVPVAVTTSGVLSGKTVTQITTGQAFTCAVDAAGVAYCWGANGSGQLGNSTNFQSLVPVAVTTSGALAGKTVTQVSAGAAYACALDTTGAAYCWGANGNGEVGNNSTVNITAPAAVTTSGVLSGKTLSQVSAGANFTCALDTTGTAYCWGANGNGQLGNNSTAQSLVPAAVTTSGALAGKSLIQITPDNVFTCALDNAGAAYCWGGNLSGQLGNNSVLQSLVPVAVTTSGVLSGKTLTQISAGSNINDICALDSGGAAYCWGTNANGQLGNPATSLNFNVPVAVTSPAGTISGGSTHTCTIRSGRAFCWGNDSNGQLGNNSTTQSLVPVAVTTSGALSGKTLIQITAGDGFTCALDSTGAAYCWGSGSSGQLGNNSITQSNVPVAVTTSGVLSGKTLIQITAGSGSACALDSTGLAYCWGSGSSGQLGNNSITQSNVPVAVTTSGALSGKTLTQVTTRNGSACALDSAGLAYCWGSGSSGQLGNNSTTQSNVAVAVTTSGVLSGKVLTQVAAGSAYACALDVAGAAYCWGSDGSGQLGNNSTTQSSVPVAVQSILPGAPTGVTATAGDTTATISWTAPSSFGTGALTGYTATASPGGASCTTSSATTCTITRLADGTTYTVMVVTHTTDGDSPPSASVTVTPAGVLAITVPASVVLPGAAPGSTASAHLGTVTVTDTRGLANASWTVTVTGTAFTTGAGTSAQTIPLTRVTYWSGAATTASGAGTFTPGQLNAASAVNLSVARTAFSLTGGSGINSGSWNPTLSVLVPASAVAGTYTATITHSVA